VPKKSAEVPYIYQITPGKGEEGILADGTFKTGEQTTLTMDSKR